MNSFVLDKLRAWQASPLLFVTEAISVTPSSQQAEALATFIQHKRHTIRSGHGTGKDAFASWDVEQQTWVLRSYYDATYCNTCEESCNLEEEECEDSSGSGDAP